MKVVLDHLQPIKLFCLEQLVFAQIVHDSLLLRNWLELEALLGGFEWLWCTKDKRNVSHGLNRRQQAVPVCLGLFKALTRRLILKADLELFGRDMPLFLLFPEHVRVYLRFQRLLNISNLCKNELIILLITIHGCLLH